MIMKRPAVYAMWEAKLMPDMPSCATLKMILRHSTSRRKKCGAYAELVWRRQHGPKR